MRVRPPFPISTMFPGASPRNTRQLSVFHAAGRHAIARTGQAPFPRPHACRWGISSSRPPRCGERHVPVLLARLLPVLEKTVHLPPPGPGSPRRERPLPRRLVSSQPALVYDTQRQEERVGGGAPKEGEVGTGRGWGAEQGARVRLRSPKPHTSQVPVGRTPGSLGTPPLASQRLRARGPGCGDGWGMVGGLAGIGVPRARRRLGDA